MRSNVGQAKPQGERDSYRAEDRSRRLYAGGRSHAQFRRRTKARKKKVPNQQTAANNPAKAATAAHGWNHRSGTACGLPFDKCSTRAANSVLEKASISEKMGCRLCPKSRRRGIGALVGQA